MCLCEIISGTRHVVKTRYNAIREGRRGEGRLRLKETFAFGVVFALRDSVDLRKLPNEQCPDRQLSVLLIVAGFGLEFALPCRKELFIKARNGRLRRINAGEGLNKEKKVE